MLITMTDGLNHLGIIPGIGSIGIREQQNQIDLIVGNAGIDLLVTALLMRKQQGQRQAGIIRDQTTGSCSGIQIMLRQDVLICCAELDHQFFLLVVSQKCDIHCLSLLYLFTGSKGAPAGPGFVLQCCGRLLRHRPGSFSAADGQRPRPESRSDPPAPPPAGEDP